MLNILRFIFIVGSFLLIFTTFSCERETMGDFSTSGALSEVDSVTLVVLLDSLKQNYPQSSDSISLFSEYITSGFSVGLNTVYSKLAMVHFSKSNYSFSELYFKKCADVLESDSLLVDRAEILANIGVVKEVSGDYTSAIDYYLRALKIFKDHQLPLKSSIVYNNIGIVYQQLNEPEKALEYYHKALEISQKLGREDLDAKRYNNIASIYEEYIENKDSAMFYYGKAHEVYSVSYKQYLPIVENNIGFLYIASGLYSKADSLFKKALSYYIEKNEEAKIAPILRNQAKLYLAQKQYKLAVKKLEEAIRLARNNHNKELEIEVLQVFVAVYERSGDYKKANTTLKQLFEVEERVKSLEYKEAIERLQVQFQVKEQTQKIEILELKNRVQGKKLLQLWFLITVLSIVLGAIIFIHRLQKKNSKLQLLQMQNDIADYVSRLEEIKEQTLKEQQQSQENVLDKLKKFGLTEREEEVLILISQGYKNAEIAEKMFVSLNTIKTHTKNIFIKLDVKNRTQAAKKAQMV